MWGSTDGAHRRSEVAALIGRGDDVWSVASEAVLRWGVKTASGFRVRDAGVVTPGQRVTVTVRVAGVTVVEPVHVVEVVQSADRVGFSYRTLPGHPVDGEEAFVVYRDGERVFITVRSLTRASARQPWRALYPMLRIAQVVVRRRYLRALSVSRG